VPTVLVPARFNGPPASGQGGYSAGTLAAHLDRPATVSLRRPVPLDEELEVRIERDVARAYADDELVVEAIAAPPLAPWDELDCPAYFAIVGIDPQLAFLARRQSELLAHSEQLLIAPREGMSHK
jgi:hypothetical protein